MAKYHITGYTTFKRVIPDPPGEDISIVVLEYDTRTDRVDVANIPPGNVIMLNMRHEEKTNIVGGFQSLKPFTSPIMVTYNDIHTHCVEGVVLDPEKASALIPHLEYLAHHETDVDFLLELLEL